jgi:hypothetical protein
MIHVFFGEMAARFIEWADSPFQREVGFASLGFAGGHILEILRTGNLAPGNAGVILYADVLIPLIGFALLWLAHLYRRETPASPTVAALR